MNEKIPQLNIETLENGNIRLESESEGQRNVIDLHPIQLRLMAETTGLIRTPSAGEVESARRAATLKRRILVLKDRINHLQIWLCACSDTRHADLTYEQDYATATADICTEFCADLIDTVNAEAAPKPIGQQGGAPAPIPSQRSQRHEQDGCNSANGQISIPGVGDLQENHSGRLGPDHQEQP